MILPKYYTEDKTLHLLQSRWTSILNPVLKNPITQSSFLENVSLKNGVTTINHGLGRTMQGWIIADINGAASIYRSQPLNNLTLTLTSNAAVTVNLIVF